MDCSHSTTREIDGYLTCTTCGLVLENFVLSFEPEWNNYDSDMKDKSRVGAHSVSGELDITFSANKHLNTLNLSTSKKQYEIQEFEHIQSMLNVSDNTLSMAKEMFQDFQKRSKTTIKGNDRRTIFIAVCIYYTSKDIVGGGRSKSKICEQLNICTKQFSRICTNIHATLVGTFFDHTFMRDGTPITDLINKSISLLKFEKTQQMDIKKTVFKLYDKLKTFDNVLTLVPTTLVSTLIYMGCLHLKIKIKLKDVSFIYNCSTTSIINTETQLRKYLTLR